MLTSLIIDSITDQLSAVPAISVLFPWGITNEAPLKDEGTESIFPWLYVTKTEYWGKDNITKRAHISMSIVWSPEMVWWDIEDMFLIIDNELLPDVDWCLPIHQWGNASVTDIKNWSMTKAMRDDKESIVMRKNYDFTYITQN